MAHASHDYKATAAKLRQLACQVQSDYCRDQLLRIAQGFDRLAKHAEEWAAAQSDRSTAHYANRDSAGRQGRLTETRRYTLGPGIGSGD